VIGSLVVKMEETTENVILTDTQDRETGTMEKMLAHRQGLLHRAFSVFIFNSKGQLLLQQRALEKYHSGGVWTNTCCGHPRHGEVTTAAANRRLGEEMGMDCKLQHQFSFIYRAELDSDLTEHEFDHVFFGTTDALPELNKDEVMACRYITMNELAKQLKEQPQLFSAWLNICFERVSEHYAQFLTIQNEV
jgi:isopentenyl-diphosphate delta-isomerase